MNSLNKRLQFYLMWIYSQVKTSPKLANLYHHSGSNSVSVNSQGVTVQAIQITTTRGREVLKLRTVPHPIPSRGELLIRVHTSGLNLIGVYYHGGEYKAPLPLIPGGEGSECIQAISEGVEGFAIGDPIAW